MTARALAKGRTNIGVGVLVGMVGSDKGRLVGTHIITVVLVATIHAGQSQNVKTEYECKEFHGANIGKNTFGCAENCRVAVVRQNKMCCKKWVGLWVALQLFLFCEGIAKRLCRKLHCRSVYVCRLMVALSGFRVADNLFISATTL
ncbi:MAG: hypothetical protein IPO65_07695 [Saprospiraceae bacterium]|nr:hypothetical protein [Saprospiraceae bacterium]